MYRVPPWKIVVVVLVFVASLWLLVPTLQCYSNPNEFRNQRKSEHLDEIERLIGEIRDATSSSDTGATDLDVAYRAERNRLNQLQYKAIHLGLDLQGGVYLVLDVDIDEVVERRRSQGTSERELDAIPEQTLEQAAMVVRQRVDEWGVSEPLVQQVLPSQIVVELAGYSNPECPDTGIVDWSER